MAYFTGRVIDFILNEIKQALEQKANEVQKDFADKEPTLAYCSGWVHDRYCVLTSEDGRTTLTTYSKVLTNLLVDVEEEIKATNIRQADVEDFSDVSRFDFISNTAAFHAEATKVTPAFIVKSPSR